MLAVAQKKQKMNSVSAAPTPPAVPSAQLHCCCAGNAHDTSPAPAAAASAALLIAVTTCSGCGHAPAASLLNSRAPFAPVTSNAPCLPGPSGLPSTTMLGKASSMASARAMNLVGLGQQGGNGCVEWVGMNEVAWGRADCDC